VAVFIFFYRNKICVIRGMPFTFEKIMYLYDKNNS